MSGASALLDATRLFLARHEEALASGDPARALDACEGLLAAVQETLPAEARRLREESPPADADHEEQAFAVLERRLAETEGLVLHLQTAFRALEAREVDVLRLVALLTAVRRSLRGVGMALELWAADHGEAAPTHVMPFEATRAARECLLANVPEAAAPPLRRALRAALAMPVGLPAASSVEEALAAWAAPGGEPRFSAEVCRALDADLARGTEDPVRAWRWLDIVEHALHEIAMSPVPRSS